MPFLARYLSKRPLLSRTVSVRCIRLCMRATDDVVRSSAVVGLYSSCEQCRLYRLATSVTDNIYTVSQKN